MQKPDRNTMRITIIITSDVFMETQTSSQWKINYKRRAQGDVTGSGKTLKELFGGEIKLSGQAFEAMISLLLKSKFGGSFRQTLMQMLDSN